MMALPHGTYHVPINYKAAFKSLDVPFSEQTWAVTKSIFVRVKSQLVLSLAHVS